jgi:hypothetical protein
MAYFYPVFILSDKRCDFSSLACFVTRSSSSSKATGVDFKVSKGWAFGIFGC